MSKHKYQTTPNERDADLNRAIKHAEHDGNDVLIIGLRDVRAELAEARALVERLPLTAEGVRVIPERNCVFTTGGSSWRRMRFDRREWWLISIAGVRVSDCWFTPEAAQAAAKEHDGR